MWHRQHAPRNAGADTGADTSTMDGSAVALYGAAPAPLEQAPPDEREAADQQDMSCLAPCPACNRHVASDETTCPFCSAVLPDSIRVSAAPLPPGSAVRHGMMNGTVDREGEALKHLARRVNRVKGSVAVLSVCGGLAVGVVAYIKLRALQLELVGVHRPYITGAVTMGVVLPR